MKGLLSRRPSPALVISIIALLVAMGGTTYAALKLPKNSVGGKQLKKNAVTGVKVKDHSLTGLDINLAKLGKVPSAGLADNASHAAIADTANAIAAPEAVHLVGAPGEPPFLSGSTNYEPSPAVKFAPAGFYKDREGIVHLQGFVVVGTSGFPPGLIFSLPPGYRPASGTLFATNVLCEKTLAGECPKDSGGDEENYTLLGIAGSNIHFGPVAADGVVIGKAGAIISLDGITFRAES